MAARSSLPLMLSRQVLSLHALLAASRPPRFHQAHAFQSLPQVTIGKPFQLAALPVVAFFEPVVFLVERF